MSNDNLPERYKAILQESEEKLRLALEAAALGTWDWNLGTGELVWSARCKEMFGFAPEADLSYELFLSALHPDDRQRADRAVREALSNHTTYSIEFRAQWRDGSIHWIHSVGRGFYDEASGQPLFMRGVAFDIDERKRAETSAIEAAEQFRFLAESLPEKIFTATADGDTYYFNQQWANYTGLPIEEVVRLGWREFVHPDDSEEKMARWTHSIKTGQPFEFEHRFRRADGVYRWHLSRAHPMRHANGTISMWIGSNTDVDDLKRAQFELRESESRSRLAIEAGRLGFWDWNIGGLVRCSPEYNRIFGIAPETSECSHDFTLSLIHPEDRAVVETALMAAQHERRDYEMEYRTKGDDASVRWVAAHGRVHYDDQTGKPVRMIGVVRDITDRKKFEDHLRRNQEELSSTLAAAELAREQAENASQAKDQFLAVLSHELRTPLTPVLMAISSIRSENNLSADVLDALDMIQRNIKIEARLIEDLLDLTRITRNKVDLHLEDLDLHKVLRQAVEICSSDVEARKHELDLHLEATQTKVHGDTARLQQVFWNLIKNAIKFTDPGGKIQIHSRNEDGWIFIEVADSGMGIPAEVLPRIFNPFEQGSQSSRQYGGLGLGLAISKATVDAHKGTLEASSQGKNMGATFVVKLATVA